MYALVYVDDILITGYNSVLAHDLINKLHFKFALKKLGKPSYFLGIEVQYYKDGSLLLTQSKYIKDLLARAKIPNAIGVPTPMLSTCKLSKHGSSSFSDASLYRSVVGALQYVTLTRPDIAFSFNQACQFMASPLEAHGSAVRKLLRYLNGTNTHGILLSPSASAPKFSLCAYSDSDQASDLDDRISTSGSCLYFGPNLVSWSSKKQSFVARSSTKAEYRALAHSTSEILCLESLLSELQVEFYTPTLLCDNLSDVLLSHNPVLHARTKHIELDIHFVRERVVSKCLAIKHFLATAQIAETLTKPLGTKLIISGCYLVCYNSCLCVTNSTLLPLHIYTMLLVCLSFNE